MARDGDGPEQSTANHAAITGPNARPIRPVPYFCTMKSANSTSSAIGTTSRDSASVATSSPSTAESTEMAGVMTPSP